MDWILTLIGIALCAHPFAEQISSPPETHYREAPCLSKEAGPYFIFISGASASGKSTLAYALAKQFGEENALVISLDEYLDKRVQPKEDFIDEIPNFDHPSMTNWKLLIDNISLLKDKQSIQTPNYDFSTWMPSGFRTLEWKPIIILEGIHATNDQLDSIPGLRIFFDIPQDVRYQRRFKRDVEERKYSPELVDKIFYEIALPYQKLYLDPTEHKAHILIKHHDCSQVLNQIIQVFERDKDTGFKNTKLRIENVLN